MTLEKWNDLVVKLNDEYGVMFGVGEDEIKLPINEEELKEAWFICPCDCQEVLYYCDFKDDEEFNNYVCPICGKEW